jgi:methionyl-tRNA synthetase
VKKKFYITTAIPYVNAPPHMGHAQEFVQTDTIAAYKKLKGYDVFLTTGSDENSIKSVQAAAKEKISAQALCDSNSAKFRKMAAEIGLSYDAFVRSSDKAAHWKGVEKLWDMCLKAGDIYKKTYSGLYCVGCEAFYTEAELVNGLCPEHLRRPEVVSEENYFFRLSKYASKLKKLIESDKLKITPDFRKSEMLNFIDQGLEDFSVSRSAERSKDWGIPVPGDSTQKIYVWFDALTVYLTGVGFGKDDAQFNRLWPADVHVIGKGILRFHAIYWPAMLMSAGLALPSEIMIHGYVTAGGQKMSKSLGNGVDPMQMLGKYGKEPLRYYLLRNIPTFEDGDFSEKELVNVSNSELGQHWQLHTQDADIHAEELRRARQVGCAGRQGCADIGDGRRARERD